MISTRTTTAPRGAAQRDALNFLFTHRIPRRFATTLAGRVARSESKWLTRAGILVWQALGGSLDLHEAEPQAIFATGRRSSCSHPSIRGGTCGGFEGATIRVGEPLLRGDRTLTVAGRDA